MIGEVLTSNTNDPYVYTGLHQDTEYGGDDAWYRNYSAEQSRWLTPDPYNGSFDLNNPQSFNRYMYVNGNPLGNVDPSGLAGAGVLTGVGGSACKIFQGYKGIPIGDGLYINPCNPVGSAISLGIAAYGASYQAGSLASNLSAWSSNDTLAGISAAVGAAITIGCSIDSNSSLCGQSGWTSTVFTGKNQWVGKAVGDSIALIGAVLCGTGPTSPECLGYAAYTIANDLFSVFWELFGPPQFTGSLLPRPSDLGGLGTAPIGIPNQNLTVRQLLGKPPTGVIPSPGFVQP